MIDKLGDGICWNLRTLDNGPASSLLDATSTSIPLRPMKGSRYGENLMRGLRTRVMRNIRISYPRPEGSSRTFSEGDWRHCYVGLEVQAPSEKVRLDP